MSSLSNAAPAHTTQTYERMRLAIGYAVDHYTQQPTLEAMARSVGMDMTQFQKTFTDWVGVSPKRFIQTLTRDQALCCLKAGESTIQAQLAAGLSSGSRLHELMVSTDGMTPAQIRALGAGTTLTWGVCNTPLGATLIAWTGVAVTHIAFGEQAALSSSGASTIQKDWPAALVYRDDQHISALASTLFSSGGAGELPSPALKVRGTGFQIQVWKALLALQAGQLVSYGAIAQALGRSGASRAVGSAVGSNPISVLIPCHRVIQHSGALGGYAWGLERKAILLGQELSTHTNGEAKPPKQSELAY